MAKDIGEESCRLHEKLRGKIGVMSKVPLKNKHDLALAYTPGVAEPCRRIAKNPDDVVVPSPFNGKVTKMVAEAVYNAAVESGISRL